MITNASTWEDSIPWWRDWKYWTSYQWFKDYSWRSKSRKQWTFSPGGRHGRYYIGRNFSWKSWQRCCESTNFFICRWWITITNNILNTPKVQHMPSDGWGHSDVFWRPRTRARHFPPRRRTRCFSAKGTFSKFSIYGQQSMNMAFKTQQADFSENPPHYGLSFKRTTYMSSKCWECEW